MAVSDIRERWRTSLIEATPDWAVEYEHVADVLGRLIWGTDTGAFYREIARLPELPTGGIHRIDWPRLTWRHGRSRTRVSTWSSPTPVVTASRTRRGDR